MGQAKLGREKFRTAMMAELEKLMKPTSPEEDAIKAEIRALTFNKILRAPDHELAYMRMQPQQCHQNAAAYAKLDPSGTSRHISGWWQRGDIFYFHSVVQVATGLHCITPFRDRDPLQFAPDPEITWLEADGVMNAERRGAKVPILVREFPERVIEEASTMLEALKKGADPKFINFTF